ncbi:MAG: hypothetical protein NTX53_18770 [candidate division WOR-3 bacterium]|nr:hypothetical protein [candidate division WOR-3 bacterium]
MPERDITATLRARYTLYKGLEVAPTWDSTFESSYTVRMGEAFDGTVRKDRANKGAARENLKKLISVLAGLSL